MNIRRSYAELRKLNTFKERFEYLRLKEGAVGIDTFGPDRYLNQQLYSSPEWRNVRNKVILRDKCCDLGIEDYELPKGKVFIHHINPITVEDIVNKDPCLFDMDNLITVSFETHNAIHYGTYETVDRELVVRHSNDTIPWRK